jgi:hypothetical protein
VGYWLWCCLDDWSLSGLEYISGVLGEWDLLAFLDLNVACLGSFNSSYPPALVIWSVVKDLGKWCVASESVRRM